MAFGKMMIITLSSDGARQIAECHGIRVIRKKGGVIHELCRSLQDAGHDPSTLVEVRRDGKLCFTAAPISHWADTMLYEDGKGFRLIKWDYDAVAKLATERA